MNKWVKLLPLVAVAAFVVACGGGKNNYGNLVSQKWVLERVEIADSASLPDVPANLTIEFSDSNSVVGRGPCNGFFGPYTVKNNDLKFGDLASTMMYCLQMPFESAYHAWLGKVEQFDATETTLELKDAEGNVKLYYTVFDPTSLEAGDFGEGEAATGATQNAEPETGETQAAE